MHPGWDLAMPRVSPTWVVPGPRVQGPTLRRRKTHRSAESGVRLQNGGMFQKILRFSLPDTHWTRRHITTQLILRDNTQWSPPYFFLPPFQFRAPRADRQRPPPQYPLHHSMPRLAAKSNARSLSIVASIVVVPHRTVEIRKPPVTTLAMGWAGVVVAIFSTRPCNLI